MSTTIAIMLLVVIYFLLVSPFCSASGSAEFLSRSRRGSAKPKAGLGVRVASSGARRPPAISFLAQSKGWLCGCEISCSPEDELRVDEIRLDDESTGGEQDQYPPAPRGPRTPAVKGTTYGSSSNRTIAPRPPTSKDSTEVGSRRSSPSFLCSSTSLSNALEGNPNGGAAERSLRPTVGKTPPGGSYPPWDEAYWGEDFYLPPTSWNEVEDFYSPREHHDDLLEEISSPVGVAQEMEHQAVPIWKATQSADRLGPGGAARSFRSVSEQAWLPQYLDRVNLALVDSQWQRVPSPGDESQLQFLCEFFVNAQGLGREVDLGLWPPKRPFDLEQIDPSFFHSVESATTDVVVPGPEKFRAFSLDQSTSGESAGAGMTTSTAGARGAGQDYVQTGPSVDRTWPPRYFVRYTSLTLNTERSGLGFLKEGVISTKESTADHDRLATSCAPVQQVHEGVVVLEALATTWHVPFAVFVEVGPADGYGNNWRFGFRVVARLPALPWGFGSWFVERVLVPSVVRELGHEQGPFRNIARQVAVVFQKQYWRPVGLGEGL